MDLSIEHRPFPGEEPKLSVAVNVGSNSLLTNLANFPYAGVVVLLGALSIALSAALIAKYLRPLFKKSHSSSHYGYNTQYGYYASSDYYAPSSYYDSSSYDNSRNPNSNSENYNYYYRYK